MMLSGSLSSISKRLRNFIIRFTILLYYGELFDIPATKFFLLQDFLILLSLVVLIFFMGRMLCFTIYTELKGEPNLDFLIYFKNIIS